MGFHTMLMIPILAASLTEPEQPNFVIIMADDMGFADASCYGGTEFTTPHIDSLAATGMKFLDYHANGPVCSPTRAALLTGRYQQRCGIDGVVYADPKQNRHHGLQPLETTFAELLSQAGYATGVSGKWHLGYEEQYNPVHHGFHFFRGYVSGNIDYVNHLDRMGIVDWWDGGRVANEPGYSTHLITKHAVEFIRQHKEHPFCLYVAHEAPHSPFQGPNDKAFRQLNRVVNEHTTPKQRKRAYREMMQAMDQGVGAIVAELDRHGLSEQTLVFFCSDNGGTPAGSNGPLRGFKGSVWEGGIRAIGIAKWTGRIAPRSTTQQLAASMDLLPTMLELADVKLPAGVTLDGVSLTKTFEGHEATTRQLFWAYRQQRAMRDGPWKLVRNGTGIKGNALFNLSADIAEADDLSSKHPQRVETMERAITEWFADVKTGATPQPAQREF